MDQHKMLREAMEYATYKALAERNDDVGRFARKKLFWMRFVRFCQVAYLVVILGLTLALYLWATG